MPFGTRSISVLESHSSTRLNTAPNLHGAITVRFPTPPKTPHDVNVSVVDLRTIEHTLDARYVPQQDATLRYVCQHSAAARPDRL